MVKILWMCKYLLTIWQKHLTSEDFDFHNQHWIISDSWHSAAVNVWQFLVNRTEFNTCQHQHFNIYTAKTENESWKDQTPKRKALNFSSSNPKIIYNSNLNMHVYYVYMHTTAPPANRWSCRMWNLVQSCPLWWLFSSQRLSLLFGVFVLSWRADLSLSFLAFLECVWNKAPLASESDVEANWLGRTKDAQVPSSWICFLVDLISLLCLNCLLNWTGICWLRKKTS